MMTMIYNFFISTMDKKCDFNLDVHNYSYIFIKFKKFIFFWIVSYLVIHKITSATYWIDILSVTPRV